MSAAAADGPLAAPPAKEKSDGAADEAAALLCTNICTHHRLALLFFIYLPVFLSPTGK